MLHPFASMFFIISLYSLCFLFSFGAFRLLPSVLQSSLVNLWNFCTRILICRSVLLTSGFESGSCFFRQWLTSCKQKIIFFKVCLLVTFWRYFTSAFREKIQKKSTDRINQGFSSFFCLWMEGSGSGSIQLMTDPDPGGPKSYGSYGSGYTTLLQSFFLLSDKV